MLIISRRVATSVEVFFFVLSIPFPRPFSMPVSSREFWVDHTDTLAKEALATKRGFCSTTKESRQKHCLSVHALAPQHPALLGSAMAEKRVGDPCSSNVELPRPSLSLAARSPLHPSSYPPPPDLLQSAWKRPFVNPHWKDLVTTCLRFPSRSRHGIERRHPCHHEDGAPSE